MNLNSFSKNLIFRAKTKPYQKKQGLFTWKHVFLLDQSVFGAFFAASLFKDMYSFDLIQSFPCGRYIF